MSYKYTGRADTFTFHGRTYAKPELYKKNPKEYDASYDSPIQGMTQEFALRLAENSRLHSFEYNGEDLLERATAPTPQVQPQVKKEEK